MAAKSRKSHKKEGLSRCAMYIAFGLLAMSLIGCTTTLTPAALERELHAGQVATLDTWDYCGSSDGYDYLINHRVALPATRRYRIAQEHGVIQTRFAYTDDQTRWVRLPWGIDPYRSAHIRQPT